MMNPYFEKNLGWLIGFAALLLGGCAATTPAPAGPPTVLVSVRIPGGRAPSVQEVTKVQEVIAPELARAGLQFARSIEQADYLLTATFTPDLGNPSEGHIAVNSIERARRALGDRADGTPSRSDQQQSLQQLDQWARDHSPPDR